MLEQKKELDRVRMEQVCSILILWSAGCITVGYDQVKEAEKKAMINGIEHNGVDQADVVIRKVNHLSEQAAKGLLSVSNYKISRKLCACHMQNFIVGYISLPASL